MKIQEFSEVTKFIAFQFTGDNIEEVQEFLEEAEELFQVAIDYVADFYGQQELILRSADRTDPTLFANKGDHVVISQFGVVDTYSDHRLKNAIKYQN